MTLVTLSALASGARADDLSPCDKPPRHAVAWTADLVQLCPTTSPLADGIPVYRSPVANPSGSTPPAGAGWLHGTQLFFVCQKEFTGAEYFHPRGWWNDWWAYTRAENGVVGWVPEVFFKGGNNNEKDWGLRDCPQPSAPPPAPANACTPSPSLPGVRVVAHFRRSKRVRTVRYGTRLRVGGRLTGAGGAPLAGAHICVGVQRRDGIHPVAAVITNARGHFAHTIGRGKSRRVWFVYRSGSAAAASNVLVRVRAPIVMRASRHSLRNGQKVLFRGRIGGRASARGLIVELQYPAGRGWQTFATTRVGRGRRFRYAYRFTRTFGTRTYQLRARLPSQRGFPFVTGVSHRVRVRVAG
jgi:hypothetical protein